MTNICHVCGMPLLDNQQQAICSSCGRKVHYDCFDDGELKCAECSESSGFCPVCFRLAPASDMVKCLNCGRYVCDECIIPEKQICFECEWD